MIPRHLEGAISDTLAKEFGDRKDIGDFLYKFSYLPVGYDLNYALVQMEHSTDPEYRRAIAIVLEMLT